MALTGLAALEPAEAVYLACSSDSTGRPLSGVNAYRLTFFASIGALIGSIAHGVLHHAACPVAVVHAASAV